MTRQSTSVDSISDATRSRAKFSEHGDSKGAAGYKEAGSLVDADFLDESGQTVSISAPEGGFPNISIGLEWDQMEVEESKVFGLVKSKKLIDVDLDLGCLYELEDGRRGALQPFGDSYGNLDDHPYIMLSGDEREGDEEGDDEHMLVNGKNWDRIKRILIYVYIYEGAPHWASIKPKIHVRIPGETPMVVTLTTYRSELPICALAGIENIRGGLRLKNYTEYFPGHAEMDRAFGFGLHWSDGAKD
jgi:tellurite resistance protein TerA